MGWESCKIVRVTVRKAIGAPCEALREVRVADSSARSDGAAGRIVEPEG